MTWKLSAVVSAGAVVVTYLMSPTPKIEPGSGARPAAARTSARQSSDGTDIQELAARLHVRVRDEVGYHQPGRDPFQFVSRPVRVPVAKAQPVVTIPPVAIPVLPTVTLSGIATDLVGSVPKRTAVLSTPAGVFLVREGESVGGIYRVISIGEDSVDLEAVADGSHRTLRYSSR